MQICEPRQALREEWYAPLRQSPQKPSEFNTARFVMLGRMTVRTVSTGQTSMLETQHYASPFGERVLLFDPNMNTEKMQETLDTLHRQQASAEFSSQRYALLFKPGKYTLDITVDYYVQAAGLGQTPDAVAIDGSVQSISTSRQNRVTTMFWRSAENFLVRPRSKPLFWAVSQAAPLRRMHVFGDLQFDRGGWASGGFLANSVVEGTAGLTTGQQWFTRNCELGAWQGGNWNRTFVGTCGAPKKPFPEEPNTVVEHTPVVRDKPFLVFSDGQFTVFVPALATDTRGVSWTGGNEAGEHIPISHFHIAKPEHDTADTLNRALASGKHLLLTPGIYSLDSPVEIRNPNTTVLGLGFPTLVPRAGNVALRTADVNGVIIAGLMFDAGEQRSSVILEIGARGASQKHADNPTSLHDVFCRVGGAIAGSADTCVEINSSNVIVDHTWLWRADHGIGAAWTVNRADHGLVVNGDDVTIYGLFNEHFQKHQTVWNGERGRVYFYQSEIPYDPPAQRAWMDGNKPGFASYKVSDHVHEHTVLGIGIYSFFGIHQKGDAGVRLQSAIEAPQTENICIANITSFAGNYGGINYPLNENGSVTNVGDVVFTKGQCGTRMPFEFQPRLNGEHVLLRPLREDDFDALFAVAADRKLWAQHPAHDRYKRAVFLDFFAEAIASNRAFAIIDKKTQMMLGSSRYHGLDETLSEIEIGWTFIARSHWGSETNAEVKRLMLHHAFQFVDTVVFWVGESNIRSRRAVEKLGATLRDTRRSRSGHPHLVYALKRSEHEY